MPSFACSLPFKAWFATVGGIHRATHDVTFLADLWELLTSFGLEVEQKILTVFGYALVSLFYLLVFYTALLGRVFLYQYVGFAATVRA